MDEKLLQRKFVQLQLLKQQMNMLLEEKKLINERIIELMTTNDALQKLEFVKQGNEIWSSLGSSVFVRSDIKDTEKVFVGVGAGAVIKSTRENAIKILDSRLDELNKVDKEIVAEITKFNEQINRLEPEVARLQEQAQEQVQEQAQDWAQAQEKLHQETEKEGKKEKAGKQAKQKQEAKPRKKG